jgi:ribose-phosphate pyrophosphokinase
MHQPFGDIKIFTCNANRKLAEDIAVCLGKPLGYSEVTCFPDGEISMRVFETVRGMDVFVIQPTSHPVNDHLMELLIMIDALRRSSAGRITAVVPYFGYARQDRKAKSHDPISAKLVANLITTAGASRILTMDLHSPQLQGFFDIPMDHLRGNFIFANYYKGRFHDMSKMVIVSPDLGSVSRASAFAAMLDVPLAIVDKRRLQSDMTEVAHFIGEVEGKTAILIDDELSSGVSLINAANTVLERGANAVYACVTHPKLSGDAANRIKDSRLSELVVLDTIAVPKEKQSEKLKVLSVAKLFSEAIDCIHRGNSIGDLFRIYPTEAGKG